LDNLNLSATLDVAAAPVAHGISLAPNPTGAEAILRFSLSQNAPVRIDIADATGRIVRTIVNTSMQAGAQRIPIATGALAPGIYQVMLRTAEGMFTQRLVVLR
jgi:hypothetical protein